MRCVILSSVRNSAFGPATMSAACAVAVLFLGFGGFFVLFVGLVFVVNEASVVAVTHKLIRVLRWHAVIFHVGLWK